MRVISRKVIGIVAVLGSHCLVANAQFDTPKHELGLSAGMFIYHGDLTPEKYGAFKSPGFALNIFYNRIISRSFSLRTNLAIGKTIADEMNYDHPDYRQQRAFRFKARVTELSEQLVWNVLANNYNEKRTISPYIFAGVGISFLNIRRDWSRFNPEAFGSDSAMLAGLNEDTLHSLPRSAAVIPVGLGFRYAISPRWSVMAEASYRIMFTDYLDGFSKAANPDKNDNYSNYAVGVIYTLGGRDKGSLKCPVIRN
jgi:hypothetical protein